MSLGIKPRESCRWDAAALGEVMLRLDPAEGRIRTTRTFQVWEGGGEYNVVRGLRRCFGQRTTVVTAIVENEVGRLLEDLMLQGGVDLSHVKWVPFDGIGRAARIGLNFTERGYGIRGAVGCSDRGWSAASQIAPGDIDWKRLFDEEGVRWFHCGGIFAALSESAADTVIEAMEAARAAGTIISYDLNFRPSLWKSQGGIERAVQVNRHVLRLRGAEKSRPACWLRSSSSRMPGTGTVAPGASASVSRPNVPWPTGSSSGTCLPTERSRPRGEARGRSYSQPVFSCPERSAIAFMIVSVTSRRARPLPA